MENKARFTITANVYNYDKCLIIEKKVVTFLPLDKTLVYTVEKRGTLSFLVTVTLNNPEIVYDIEQIFIKHTT